MTTLLRHFAQGTLIAVPIAISAYVVYRLFTFVDGLLHLEVPGLGLAVTLALITLLGFVASSVIGARLFGLAERVFRQLPFVKILYGAIKDLVGAFVGERKGFDRPVSVELPGSSGRVFGFATREHLDLPGFEGYVIVYFPQSYNFAGNMLAVPRGSVTALDVKSSELMSFVMSGGITGLSPQGELRARR